MLALFEKHTEIPKQHTNWISMTSGIVIDGVSKDYGTGVKAVKPTCLRIERGEFFSLLGSSGSGKTTMLKMLSGLEYPTTGTITLEGVDVTHMPANRRDVHTVFQNYALFPHMNVAKNVAYGLEGRHMAKDAINGRVRNMLELVDLAGHENDMPDALSGGMQQRVALARALVMEPKALLLDEPLGALDLKLRHHMQEVLRDIHQKVGITFVYVTHDQEEAFSMSDRIGIMSKGEIMQVSSPEELYRHPSSNFVADFVGASNMLTGTVEEVCDKQGGIYKVRFDCVGETTTVSGVPSLRTGEQVLGVLRPQDIYIDERPEGDDILSAEMTIESHVFLGGQTKLSLRFDGFQMTAVLARQNASLTDSSQIAVCWRARDLWAVAA